LAQDDTRLDVHLHHLDTKQRRVIGATMKDSTLSGGFMRTRLALSLLFVATAALAQSRETINVSVIEVPVTVLDRSGNPVRGLKASNFEIYDGGQKRELSSFDSIDFASAESVRSVSPLNPAARRTFMILFDMTFSKPEAIRRAQEAARMFLAHGLQRRDLVSVATLDVERGFRLLTNFTTDRSMVARAIADPRGFQSSDPLQITSNDQMEISPGQMTGSTTGEKASRADAEMREMAALSASNDDRFRRQRIDRQMSGLASLARALRAVPGRKQLLFLSEGFDPRLVQGRGATERADQVKESEAVVHGEIWTVDTDNRYGNTESQTNLDRMAQLFRRSDVVLNAVDIQGVRVQNDTQKGSVVNSNEGLSLLALPTGGTVFKNSNDITNDLDRVLKQQEVVYILAFKAPTGTPGKLHDLKIKLVDVPGGKANHRAGYYELGGEGALERTLTNAEIVLNDIPTDDVHMSVLAAPFPTGATTAQVPVIAEINGEDLVRLGKGGTTTLELYVYAFDDQGVVRDSLFQRIALDLVKVGETLKGSGVKYYGTLSLREGSYAIKTLVRIAESDRKGYARRDIVVGHDGDVLVSQPFFFEPSGKWLMVKGASHDKSNAGYPFAIAGQPFIPSAGVHFKSGEPRMFAVFLYGALPDEVTVETSPKATLRSATRTADGRGGKMTFQLDAAPASTSAVVVTVKKNGSTDARTSSLPIIVQRVD
jgi:VWFA-related protein